ncbi:hypothetical protein ACFXGR_51955 [Streptomyces mirabilis]|uniref:hypothetical protein n=1 Tax=Streptomyces mirabilis TaxID=68239 RepID=UPI003685242B
MTTIWSQQTTPIREQVHDLRGSAILADCGPWIQQERPEAVNRDLLSLLNGL